MSLARDIADLGSVTARLDTVGASSGALSNRNLVINGAMNVAQRGTSSTGIGASAGYFTCDRWYINSANTAGRLTMSQASDGPSGFANCIKLDCTTADTSIASNESLRLIQRFEGQDLQQFAKGTSAAKEFTVSFYVKANAAFTFGCELFDNDNSRQISKTFSTTTDWVRHEITFPADTTGAFTDDNALSLQLQFWLHAGSDFTSGTLNSTSWASNTDANRAVGIGSFFSSTSNDFYITGVQLEVGDTATDFEHEPYSVTLAKAQRYYQKWTANDAADSICSGPMISDTAFLGEYFFRQTMRVEPTLGYSGNFQVRIKSQDRAIVGNPQLNRATADNLQFYIQIADNNEDGFPAFFKAQTAGTYVEFISEL